MSAADDEEEADESNRENKTVDVCLLALYLGDMWMFKNNKQRKLQRGEKKKKKTLGTHQEIKNPTHVRCSTLLLSYHRRRGAERLNAQQDKRSAAPSAALLTSLIPDGGQNVITVVGYLMCGVNTPVQLIQHIRGD